MCCFLSALVLFGPRLAVLIWWFIRPAYYTLVFGNNWFWPILGVIFLPWTTLMYLLVFGANGIVGFDWVWLGLAFIADLGSYGGSAYGNRDRFVR
jgi:hypothetical protein